MSAFLLTLALALSPHRFRPPPLCTPQHHEAPCIAVGDNEPTVPASCVTGTPRQRARRECAPYG